MKTVDVNTNLINGYLEMLKNFSPDIKFILIEKLLKSLKFDLNKKKKSIKRAFSTLTRKRNQ